MKNLREKIYKSSKHPTQPEARWRVSQSTWTSVFSKLLVGKKGKTHRTGSSEKLDWIQIPNRFSAWAHTYTYTHKYKYIYLYRHVDIFHIYNFLYIVYMNISKHEWKLLLKLENCTRYKYKAVQGFFSWCAVGISGSSYSLLAALSEKVTILFREINCQVNLIQYFRNFLKNYKLDEGI